MIDICMALDQSVSPHTGVRTIQNTGVFWQAVFQPPRPYSLFFGTRLRRQNGNLAPTQYRKLRRLFSVLNSVAHSFRIFLGSPKLPCVLTFPYRVPVPKNCVIFIDYHFESRASQVGLRKREIKDLRIIGLEERKCRRLVKQYFHRNFRDNVTCIICLFLPVFSGLLD